MSSIGIIELIPNWILIALGVALIGLEIFIGFFVLLWFGLGLVVVGILGFFVDFGYGEYQLIFASAIGIVLLFAFRKKVITPKNAKVELLSTYQPGGTGTVSRHNNQWVIFYRGTHWVIANPHPDLVADQKVEVTEIKDNQAWIATSDPALN